MKSGDILKQKSVISDQIIYASIQACRNQVLSFARLLKMRMLEEKMEPHLVSDIIKHGFEGYANMDRFKADCLDGVEEVLQIFLQPNNRGRDNLGRLLVEYCFIRPYQDKPLLRAQNSAEDLKSREEFVPGIIPRPLINYFLVSLRGTVEGLDNFRFLPMLFGFDDPDMEDRYRRSAKIIRQYRQTFAGGKEATDWEKVYEDKRSIALIASLIPEILNRITGLGESRFLNILNNIQHKDEMMNDEIAIKRIIVPDDFTQIIHGLKAGQHFLTHFVR